jgi:hypothetical protein
MVDDVHISSANSDSNNKWNEETKINDPKATCSQDTGMVR